MSYADRHLPPHDGMNLLFWILVALAAGMIIAGCATPQHVIDGWAVEWNDHAPQDSQLRIALKVLRDNAPCDDARRFFGGGVEWKEPVFECTNGVYSVIATGCQPYRFPDARYTMLQVGYVVPLWKSALVDEIGHCMWQACGLRDEDFAYHKSPTFQAWIDVVRLQVQLATENRLADSP